MFYIRSTWCTSGWHRPQLPAAMVATVGGGYVQLCLEKNIWLCLKMGYLHDIICITKKRWLIIMFSVNLQFRASFSGTEPFFSRRGTLQPSGAEGYAFGVWASNGADLAKRTKPCDAIWSDLAMMIWANYNDLTTTEPWKSWLVRGIIPKWP